MFKIIDQLILKYEIKEIEAAFIQLFIEFNKIKVSKNKLIKSILDSEKETIRDIKDYIKKDFKKINLYDLINVFELLIPKKDRKLNGAFFTPKSITDFIVKNTIKSDNQKICDPSCGCGAFLVDAVVFINDTFGKDIVNIIEDNIYGADIASYSVRRAKILLTLLALQNDEDCNNINYNIAHTDSLKADWNKLFDGVSIDDGFDVVIGNPPYVKFQDLEINIRNDLFKNWSTLKNGNYNLYFAFFELGLQILNDKGILGYITPNNYFTSLAGVSLRKYLASNKFIDKIVDFNHLKLFNAQTYTCITFLKKQKREYFLYERIDDYEKLKNLSKLKYSQIKYSQLNNRKWRLLKDIDQKNIENIENIGHRLGEVVDIRVGVATCKDSVYFINGDTLEGDYYYKEYNNEKYPIEKDITKPIAKISDFKTQEALDNNKRRIIFPYTKNNGDVDIIPEKELENKYPKCHKYLLDAKDELLTRDKGKVEYPEWYAYARTQGLNFHGKKLLTPTFSAEPRFLKEDDVNSMFCNGYAIFLKQKNDLFFINHRLKLDALAKILNSKVMDYYIKKTSVSIQGGYPCYQKNFIELFGIPDLSSEEIDFLERNNDKEKIYQFLLKKYKLDI